MMDKRGGFWVRVNAYIQKRKITNLFGKYIENSAGLLVTHDAQQSRKEVERIIIAVSLAGASPTKFSAELYDHVAELVDKENKWTLDSLVPIPVISVSVSGLGFTREDLINFIKRLSAPEKRFRVVCGKGIVEYGNIGQGTIMTYASCGEIISRVVEGVVALPVEHSWGDEGFMNLLNLPLVNGRDASGRAFYPLNVG
jgi:hypothetical protein